MQYNRLTNPNALLDLIKSLDRRVSNVETKGTGPIGFVGSDGVELHIGVQPDGEAAIVPFVGDTTPPPVASAPTAVPGPGFISVTWDGLFFDLAEKPRDFDNLNVIGHKVVSGSITTSVAVGTLRSTLDTCLVGTDVMPVGETWKFSFVSEDYNGNLSAFSAYSAVATQQSFAADVLIDGALADLQQDVTTAQNAANTAQSAANAAQIAADEADAAALEAAGIANSKGKVITSSTAPATADQNVNNLWIDTTNGANTPKRWNGSAWVAVTDKVATDAASAAAAAQTKADQAFNNAATASAAAGTAQTTADGKNRAWYQNDAPAGTSHKNGDQWFDTNDGNKLYLWTGSSWVSFQDAGIAAAQGTASTALTSANGKNKIYYQTSMPSGGTYITGDTWFDTDDGNKIYVHNGTTFIASQDASIATAQTTANTANTTANSALTTANSKTKTYFQTAQPGTSGNTTGDIWFDTDDGNKVYVWNGSSWASAQDAGIAAAQTSANGKNTIFYQTSAPATTGRITGDTWFDTDDGNKIYVWNGSAWTASQDAAIAAAQTAANTANTAAGAAQTTANSKTKTFIQGTAPTATTVGDIWIDTANGNVIKTWEGSSWVTRADAAIASAQGTANTALTSANGKNKVYYQTAMPTGGTYILGDTWFDTDDGNKIYVHNGTTFVASQDASIATAQSTANTANTTANSALTTANSKTKTYFQTAQPGTTGNTTGDIWFDTDDGNKVYVWNGSAWTVAQDAAISAAQTSANGKNTIFYQTSAPSTTGRTTGDTWFDTDDGNKIYVWNGTAWTASQDAAIAAAQTTANTANTAAGTAQTTANSKTKTFIQGTAPTATTTGDIWIDTANGNVIKTWEGSSWVTRADAAIAAAQTTANSAQTSANGKNKIYYQTTQPSGGTYITGDTWFDTDDGNKIYVYNGSTWVASQDATIATAQSTANTANTTANTALTTATSKTKTYFQTAQPSTSGNTTGDIWFDTDDGNKVYVWNGSAWTVAQDAAIAAAQTSANGKNKNYYQTTQPSGGTYISGDLWFDTDDNYKMYTYTGSAWQLTQDAIGAKTAAQLYTQSRGMDLVTNGNGQLGNNTNFSSFVFDQIDTPTGAVGVFKSTAINGSATNDELIRIDPAKSYRFRVSAKQLAAGVITAAYTGLSPIDNAGLAIQPYHYMEQAGTRTTLASTLSPGATTISLTSSASWNNAGGAANTHLRSMIVWNYVDSFGKTWAPGTYSRNWYTNLWDEGGITGNTITLKTPWAGPTIAAGTAIGNGTSGGNYMYVGVAGTTVPETWTNYSGTVSGVHTNLALAATTAFPSATSYVKLIFLPNRTVGGNPTTGSTQAFGNLSLSEVSAGNLEASGITETLLAANAVTTTKIADLAITSAKISALDAGKITTGTLDANRIGADTITATHIASDAITANELAANSITAAKGQISNLAVGTAQIQDTAITTAKIANLAVTDAQIASATITSAKIANLDAAKITTGTLDANRIGANSISANKIFVGDLTNLAADGNFTDTAKANWVGSGTVTAYANEPNRLRVVTAASGNNDQANTNLVQVTAGEQIYGEVWVYGEAANVGAGGPNMHLVCVSNAGVLSWPTFQSLTRAAVSGQWVLLKGTITIPANTKTAKVELAVTYSADAVGNIYYFREVSVRRKASGNLIVDGAIQAGSLIIGTGAIGTAQIGNLAVGTAQIADTAITTAKIANLAVTDAQIASATITSAKIANLDAAKITTGTLDANRIGADTITATHIASDAITANELAANSITAAKGQISNLAVGTAQIQDTAITTAKIANLAVTDAQIASATITSAKIANLDAAKITTGTLDANRIGADSITSTHIASDAITTNELAAGSITASKGQISNLAVGTAQIADTAITTAKIANLAVTDAQIAAATITNAKIANLDAAKITTGTLDAGRIGADTITATHIAADAVTVNELAANSITAAKGQISDLAVTTAKIDNVAITSAKIADLAVTDAKIANATITNAKIANLDAAKITTGTLDAGRIGANSILTAHLSSGNIDASVLSAGSITAAKIASKSITADKLVITSTDNLVVEADFGNGGTSWDLTPAYKFIMADRGRGSLPALRIVGSTSEVKATNVANRIKVDQNNRYRAAVWVKSTEALPVGAVKVYLRCYTTATAYTDITALSSDAALVADTWTFISPAMAPALPAGTVAIEVILAATNGTTTTWTEFDYVSVTRAMDAKLVVDGSITAVSIDANAVTASKIAADAVTATKISATAIDGKTITGATIQTETTTDRGIKLTSTEFAGFDATGVKNFSLTSAGVLSLKGSITSGSTITGATVTGSTVQTEATTDRGIKLTSTGLTAYTSTGGTAFSLSASTGRATIAGRIATGLVGEAGSVLLPASESDNGTTSGLFITRTGGLSGGTTAGAFVYQTTSTSPQNLFLRGHEGGHVEVETGHLYVRGSGMRIGNFSNWAIGDNTTNGNNYVPNLAVIPNTGNGYLRLAAAPTSSSAANAIIAVTPEGQFYRSTSSIKYKADVQDWDADYRALGLKPRSWVDRNPIDPAAPLSRYYGYIAEEVEEVMPEFVSYDEFGDPESVTYDRMPSPATIAILKDIVRRLDAAGL